MGDKSIGGRFASDIKNINKNGTFKGFTTPLIILMGVVFFAVFFLGVFVYKLVKDVTTPKELSLMTALLDMLKYHFIGAMILFLIALSIALLVTYKAGSSGPERDRKGNLVDETGLGGKSKYQTAEVLSQTYDLISPKDYQKGNFDCIAIYGQLKDGEREILTYQRWNNPKPKYLPNQNIFVTGMSGSGKTKYFLISLAFQNILKKMGLITTDPKGEIYSETASLCLYNEVGMYIFNLKNLTCSDGVDILKLIRLSSSPQIMADALVETLLKPSRMAGGGVGFFNDTNANLLYLACLYVAKAKAFVPYDMANSSSEIIPAGYDPSDCGTGLQYYKHRTFEEVCKLITSVDGANVVSMQQRVELAVMTDPDDEELLRDAYRIWWGHTKTRDDTQASTAVALKNIVQNPLLRKILSVDEIDFNEILKRRSALYVVTAVGDTTYSGVLSLIFDFIMRAMEQEKDKTGGELTVRQRLIFEELGVMNRLPKLEGFVSNCRSWGVGTVICTQSIPQGVTLYPDGEFGAILNNCAVKMCRAIEQSSASGHDETADYFCARSGEYGAIERLKSYEKGIFGIEKETGESERMVSQNVITRDDIFDMSTQECVLTTATHSGAVMLDSIFFKDHPAYRVKFVNKETGLFEKPNDLHHIPKWRGGKSVSEELHEKYEIRVLSPEECEDLKEKEYKKFIEEDDEEKIVTTYDELL